MKFIKAKQEIKGQYLQHQKEEKIREPSDELKDVSHK